MLFITENSNKSSCLPSNS